jgi:hypothetical protein
VVKVGSVIKIGNELFTIRKEYLDGFLAIDEFLTTYKRIPKLVRIK